MDREPWRPTASRSQQIARAVQSMASGSVQGRIAEASPVRSRYLEQIEQDSEADLTPSVEFMQDGKTVTDAGQQDLTLTYVPIKESEHVYWNGTYQPASEWTRDGVFVTVLDPAGMILPGDEVVVEYAHLNEGSGLVPLSGLGQRTTAEDSVTAENLSGNDTGDWSMNFLYQLLATPSVQRTVTARSSGVGATTWWRLYVQPSGALTLSPIDAASVTGGSVIDGKPHMITVRYDATAKQMTFAIDAVTRGTAAVTTVRPGMAWAVNGAYFSDNSAVAAVDEVSHFPYRLSDVDVSNLMLAWKKGDDLVEAVTALGPDKYYRLDETGDNDNFIYDLVSGGRALGNLNPVPALQWGG